LLADRLLLLESRISSWHSPWNQNKNLGDQGEVVVGGRWALLMSFWKGISFLHHWNIWYIQGVQSKTTLFSYALLWRIHSLFVCVGNYNACWHQCLCKI